MMDWTGRFFQTLAECVSLPVPVSVADCKSNCVGPINSLLDQASFLVLKPSDCGVAQYQVSCPLLATGFTHGVDENNGNPLACFQLSFPGYKNLSHKTTAVEGIALPHYC